MNAFISRAGLSSALVLSALVSFLHPNPAAGQPAGDPCQTAGYLSAGAAWVSEGSDGSAGESLAIHIPEPGWLAVEAFTGGASSSGAAWLAVVSTDCGGDTLTLAGGHELLGPGLIEVLDPGTLYLEAGAVDLSPDGEPRSLHVVTHFVEAGGSALEHLAGGDGGPGDDTEEEDGEILPLTLPSATPAVIAYRADGADFRNLFGGDGGPGDDTEEEDGEILPLFGPGDSCFATRNTAWPWAPDLHFGHDGGPGDDTEEEDGEILPLFGPTAPPGFCTGEPANGFAPCAQELALGDTVTGRLDLESGFDRDVFTFRVKELQQVEISVEGPYGLNLTMTDLLGRELARRRLTKGPITLSVALIPGPYFLRVEGVGGDAEYRITVE